ncbi:MAG: 1-acyl-sn-glycerol-3-phosphate acyltransferase [Candidatus Thermoplasmatota archaeon]|nr:1-acyl-sn-glycerol-3-phosphate acyltransferase [Candidatus Thermoplasmatota archaeon]
MNYFQIAEGITKYRDARNMQRTIFDAPILRSIMRGFAGLYLRIIGWEALDNRNGEKNYVAIFAPHTSAWDFVNLIMLAMKLNIKTYWLGKHSLFRKRSAWLFRYLGGLPIDRTKKANTVEQIVHYFKEIDDMVFTLAPEGTRKPVDRWKTGFYHMAVGAGVPIAIVSLDYKRRRGGISQMFYPTGDIKKDMIEIRGLYKDVVGKHPGRFVKLEDEVKL